MEKEGINVLLQIIYSQDDHDLIDVLLVTRDDRYARIELVNSSTQYAKERGNTLDFSNFPYEVGIINEEGLLSSKFELHWLENN